MLTRRMRILMLSWEYPPLTVGGPGRHVHALATALAAGGHEVTVVTRHTPGAPHEEYDEGVHIVRAAEDPAHFPAEDGNLVAWTTAFNHTLTRAALRVARSGQYDVVHAHGWLVAHAAVTLREHLDVPMIATVHATEAGRHQGTLPLPHHHTIDDIEHWLVSEAARVIVCSDFMRREVQHQFAVPPARTVVIRNGVDVLRWYARPPEIAAARRRYAGDAPLITFAGRLVPEKGVQHLLDAVPRLAEAVPGLRVVIAGDGPERAGLEARAPEGVTFAGHLPGPELTALMAASDCHVVPGEYEPSGMVALEATAAGTPVVAAATGGLTEIVEEGVSGVTFAPGDPEALAAAVVSVLTDREHSRALARGGRRRAREDFAWPALAARTAGVYHQAVRGSGIVAREAERLLALEAEAAGAEAPVEETPAGRPSLRLLTSGDDRNVA